MLRTPVWTIVGFIFATALALSCIWGAFAMWHEAARQRRAWRRVRGRVIGREERPRGAGDGGTYSAVIEYHDHTGTRRTFTSETRTRWKPRLGRSAVVLYHPEDPTLAEVQTLVEAWLLPLVIAAIGVLFGTLGLLLVLRP